MGTLEVARFETVGEFFDGARTSIQELDENFIQSVELGSSGVGQQGALHVIRRDETWSNPQQMRDHGAEHTHVFLSAGVYPITHYPQLRYEVNELPELRLLDSTFSPDTVKVEFGAPTSMGAHPFKINQTADGVGSFEVNFGGKSIVPTPTINGVQLIRKLTFANPYKTPLDRLVEPDQRAIELLAGRLATVLSIIDKVKSSDGFDATRLTLEQAGIVVPSFREYAPDWFDDSYLTVDT